MRTASFAALTTLLVVAVTGAHGQDDLCAIVDGAQLIAQDNENTYLGRIANQYDSESIFNEYGSYGSEYNSDSIWNEYGTFGGKYSTYSPHNPHTSSPPMIVKNRRVIGYLSANKSIKRVRCRRIY
jgi:hypothetical protein